MSQPSFGETMLEQSDDYPKGKFAKPIIPRVADSLTANQSVSCFNKAIELNFLYLAN